MSRLWVAARGVGTALLTLGLVVSCQPLPSSHAAPRSQAVARWPSTDPRVELTEVRDLLEIQSARGRRIWARVIGEAGPKYVSSRPFGLCWLDDDLLISDPNAGKVLRLEPGGRWVAVSQQPLSSPIDLAFCEGEVLVTDSVIGGVARFAPDLKWLGWLIRDLSRPTGIACEGGRVFVAETGGHAVLELNRDGTIVRRIGERGEGAGSFNFPTAIAVDGDTLWVADVLNFRVQAVSLISLQSRVVLGGLGDSPTDTPRTKGIALDSQGKIWLTDAHLDRISIYRNDGALLLNLGRNGSGPGEFSFPAGVAAHPDGRVAVVDSFNRRIQIFRTLDASGPWES